jgi:hypothetical protein
MAWLVLVDRIVIPAVVLVLLVGGIGGTVLGCALALRSECTLRFMARMNRWVSTREALAPLEATHSVEPAPGPGARRPLLGAFLALGGALTVYFVLARLDFTHSAYVPGVDARRWFLSGLVLGAMKWVLVAGSALAGVVGALMLLAPQYLARVERRLNQAHSSASLLAADEKMHTPLEAQVASHPRAAGWAIAAASLLVSLAMLGLLLSRLH